jgi:hypothetical protein
MNCIEHNFNDIMTIYASIMLNIKYNIYVVVCFGGSNKTKVLLFIFSVNYYEIIRLLTRFGSCISP